MPDLVCARAPLAVEQRNSARLLRGRRSISARSTRSATSGSAHAAGGPSWASREPGPPAGERLEAGVERIVDQEQRPVADHRGRPPDHVRRPQTIGDRPRILRQRDARDGVLWLEQDPGAVAPRGPALVDPAEHAAGPVRVPPIALLEEGDPRAARGLGRDPKVIRAAEPRGDVDAAQPACRSHPVVGRATTPRSRRPAVRARPASSA